MPLIHLKVNHLLEVTNEIFSHIINHALLNKTKLSFCIIEKILIYIGEKLRN